MNPELPAPPVGSVSAPPADAAEPRLAWLVAGVTALIAVVALVVAWRADERLTALEQELVRRQQDSSTLSAEAKLLARQSDESVRAAAAKVALLEARVGEVALQRSQFEELIQSLSRSRDENLVVDIEAALRVALQQSSLTGSVEPLVATLRQSDERLGRYSQPRLEGVRRAIARDLDKVRATGVTDVAVLTIRIDEAIRLIDELPLLATPETRREPSRGVAPATSAPGQGVLADLRGRADAVWSQWTTRVWDEARSLVRVTRIDHPEALLLQPENMLFLRENLKLRLLNARLALLSRQFAVAQADLAVAQAALERYFDRNARRTVNAIDLVRQVGAQSRQVVLPRPDDTLAALAAVAAGR